MRSRIGFAFLVVLIVAGAFLLQQDWATPKGGTASEVNAAEADALIKPDALLAPAPPRAEEAPTAAPPPAPASTDPPEVPRRFVRARLVAFDASTGETVVPRSRYRWFFAAGCDGAREKRVFGKLCG